MKENIYRGIIRTLLPLAAAAALTASCNVYDDTDDCNTELRIKFKYDYNMEYADAFANEVRTIHFQAFDESGHLVLQKTEQSTGEGYLMNVDELQPEKKYDFVVWAEGEQRPVSYLYGSGDTEEKFGASMPMTPGGPNTSEKDLTPLFHGRLTAQEFKRAYGTTQTITIPLVKDTKDILVHLEELDSKEPMQTSDYTMTITDDNTVLNYDNSLSPAGGVVYRPWSLTPTSTAGTQTTTGVIGEFTTNRLVKQKATAPVLTVSDRDGKKLFSFPILDYFLAIKSQHLKDMDDQEFLDRQDAYSMTFFLQNGKWVTAEIYINAWRVVIQNTSL